jgi:hypothetical protein
MTTMTVAMATVHAVSAMAVAMSAAMTTVATSRSRGDGSSGQSDCGDSCECNFTKHTL